MCPEAKVAHRGMAREYAERIRILRQLGREPINGISKAASM
jgi:hypothetical protein